jgi:cytoskeletal protein RodZ
MNVSRIEVSTALPEPHFEDEATVVSARQVVPIEQARVQDRRRKLLAILPILLAAAFCGGVGAIAVNYFEQRSSAPATSQPSTSSATEERQQVAPAASPDNRSTASTDSRDEPDTSQPSGSALATDSSKAANSLESSKIAKSDESVASVQKPSSSTDPKQLVRPRRVHPPSLQPRSSQNDQRKSRGAAKIQDIFSGPNP